mmetsp:Transcript_200/g.416  ORF Transcript_200/g.416 Transcript_200/m.416 type:complete len:87 (-) Transcript_200:732-992(-)
MFPGRRSLWLQTTAGFSTPHMLCIRLETAAATAAAAAEEEEVRDRVGLVSISMDVTVPLSPNVTFHLVEINGIEGLPLLVVCKIQL